MLLLANLLLLSACTGKPVIDTSDSGEIEYCVTIEDAGEVSSVPEGGNAISGNLELQLITNVVSDPHDQMYTAFKSYTLVNSEMEGIPTTGETSGDGRVSKLLGEGPWDFQAAYTRGSITCTADLAMVIAPNTTTYACAMLTCPTG